MKENLQIREFKKDNIHGIDPIPIPKISCVKKSLAIETKENLAISAAKHEYLPLDYLWV